MIYKHCRMVTKYLNNNNYYYSKYYNTSVFPDDVVKIKVSTPHWISLTLIIIYN